VPGVLGHQLVVFPDESGDARLALPVGRCCDVPAPDRVVTQPQAANSDTIARRPPAVRGTVLVDVAVHDVEVPRLLRKPIERIPDPVAHPIPDACRTEV